MAEASRLTALAEWLMQHPDVALQCARMFQELEDELHALAHETLEHMEQEVPCHILHTVFASLMGLGYAASKRSGEAVGTGSGSPDGEPPVIEQDSSGSAMSIDDLRRLFER